MGTTAIAYSACYRLRTAASVTNIVLSSSPRTERSIVSSLAKAFGRRLAQLRAKAGKTQEQLEWDGAASRTYVSELERGEKEPSLAKIYEIARAVGVSPASLVADLDRRPQNDDPRTSLADLLSAAARHLREQRGIAGPHPAIDRLDTFLRADELLQAGAIEAGDLLGEATRLAVRRELRVARDAIQYLVADKRPLDMLRYTTAGAADARFLDPQSVVQTVREANRVLELLHDMAVANGVPIFKLLGMRNLSSFVGEIFKSELCRINVQQFAPNPHQDGYPDLCALSTEGVAYFAERIAKGEMSDKSHWSPYPYGGIEVKATCGNTPPAKLLAKPDIGDSRWPILKTAEWKAHHRKTNNLVGIFWDFIDGLPTVLAAFFRNDLTANDWGAVIKPATDESSTTSVSIMPRGKVGEEVGVKKMARGWVVLPADPAIRGVLTRKDIFYLTETDIKSVTSSPVIVGNGTS